MSNLKLLLIFLGSLLFYIPFLGEAPLFDWDEINFAECSREMILTGDYSTVQINFKSFWEKPPFFFWLQVISMQLFGVNEFAARFPNAMAGAVSLVFVFWLARRVHNEKMAWWWIFFHGISLLPHFYFRSGIIDPWFNLFIFSGIAFHFLYTHTEPPARTVRWIILSGICFGLATLTKGPVALLIGGVVILFSWLLSGGRTFPGYKQAALLLFITLLTSFSWFITEALRGNSEVVSDFINYQVRLMKTEDAGHGGPFYYHFVVLLLGCFPASIPAIAAMGRGNEKASFRTNMLILFWTVLIIFSLVQTKIVHYSSLAYFPVTYLAAWYINSRRGVSSSGVRLFTIVTGVILSIAFIAVPLAAMNSQKIIASGLVKDDFVNRALEAGGGWGLIDFLPGLIMGCVLIWSWFASGPSGFFSRLLAGTALSVFLASVLFAPKIGRFSQGAAVDFYQKISAQPGALAQPIGFKSYAHLFYGRRPVPASGSEYPENLLSSPPAGHVVYAVSKVQDSIRVTTNNPALVHLYSSNGFVFWKLEK